MKEILAEKTIVDMTRLLPGPACTMFLGDFGARVIKVEQPGPGDYARWGDPKLGDHSAVFSLVNRNKESVTLDLKTEGGHEAFLKLINRADALVEGFRPGVLERLNVGHERLLEENPSLVLCSISGYGQDGPMVEEPGHDINYISVAGLQNQLVDGEEDPILPGVQFADIAGGSMMALIGVLGGLMHQERTGEGQVVDVSMTDGVVPFLFSALATYFATGESPRPGDDALRGSGAHYRLYECSQGGHVAVGALEPQFVEAIAEVLDRPDLTNLDVNSEEMHKELESIFLEKDRFAWENTFRGHNAPVTAVRTLEEAVESDHATARNLYPELTTDQGQTLPQVAFPVQFSETPTRLQDPPPELGEHTESVLQELGYTEEEIADLHNEEAI